MMLLNMYFHHRMRACLKLIMIKKMLIGVKEGNAVVTASQGSIKGTVKVTVTDCPVLTAYCSDIEREVPECMFGYILTPNYDVPDSRNVKY